MTYIYGNVGNNSQNTGNNEIARQFMAYKEVALGLAREIENNADILIAKLEAQQPDGMIDNTAAKRLADASNTVDEMREEIAGHTCTMTGFPEIPDELSINCTEVANSLFALRELAAAMKTGHDKLVSLKRLL